VRSLPDLDTNSLTDSCFVDLIDVTLAVAHIGVEESVADSCKHDSLLTAAFHSLAKVCDLTKPRI